jgi:Ca-dependent carbohydrate-binding module xylan-binding
LLADLAMQQVSGVSDQPHHLNIDYIRAYSNNPNATAVALDPISSPDGADTSSLYGATALGSSPTTGSAATLTVRVSGDHYAGDPQFEVFVDGQQIGGIHSVQAVHANGQWQDITLSGHFDPDASHHIDVRFINDGWDGLVGEGHDRNLYIGSLAIGTHVIDGTSATSNTASFGNDSFDPDAAVMAGNGTVGFDMSSSQPPTGGDDTSTPTPPGSSGTISLHVSGDHYEGDPQFEVFVDGQQIGGPQSVQAVHANGQWQDIALSGNFDPNASHHIDVLFVNDRWDGLAGEGHDRNLYIGSLTIGTHVIDGTSASSNTASFGYDSFDPHAAVMVGNGLVGFDILLGA